MAGDINRVILIGRLTRDPELRYTPSGTAVASFTIANNRTYAVAGEKKEEVSFFDCIAWAKLGEIITEYCKKGQRIAVEGRIQQRRWEDQDKNKRSKIELVIENFQFLTARGGGDEPAQSHGGFPQDSSSDYSSSNFDDNPFSEDDIPF
ncbi:MAG: single-stranded DNA-binding protein [Spirochaetota bacterium]